MNEIADQNGSDTAGTANIVYILYLLSLAIGITGIVGLVMAYMNKEEAPDWLKTHYRFQIRTFWIGFLYVVISLILTTVIIGFLLLVVCAVWYIIRCVKGMKYLNDKQAYPTPASWLF